MARPITKPKRGYEVETTKMYRRAIVAAAKHCRKNGLVIYKFISEAVFEKIKNDNLTAK